MANAATTPCHVFAFALAPRNLLLSPGQPFAGLGGVAFERVGNYDAVSWLAVLSAVINLPIAEQPARRLAPATAG
jgi:hypothetical protein